MAHSKLKEVAAYSDARPQEQEARITCVYVDEKRALSADQTQSDRNRSGKALMCILLVTCW